MICEYFHRLTILQIFVCGGEVDSKILANGEVYDPQVYKNKQLYIVASWLDDVTYDSEVATTENNLAIISGRQLVSNRKHD